MTQKLLELANELEQADEQLKAAAERERLASADSTAARNRVNKAQKAIDAEMAAIKNKADWNTDWHSERSRRTSAAPPIGSTSERKGEA